MKTIEPRAATGTLDELTPVAPLTTPFGLITGVGWAANCDATNNEHARHFGILIPGSFLAVDMDIV